MKHEPDEEERGVFSPEAKELIRGLGDSPESMALKAEILSAASELRRGDQQHELFFESICYICQLTQLDMI